MRIQSPLTRQEVLVAAEAAGHCRNQRQRCIVRKDGQIQPEQMTTPMTVGDGTYIQIDVPPMEDICDGATNLLQTKVKMVSRLRRQTDTLKLLYELERSSVQPTDIAAFFRVGCDNNVVCYLCRANWTHHTFDDLPPRGTRSRSSLTSQQMTRQHPQRYPLYNFSLVHQMTYMLSSTL